MLAARMAGVLRALAEAHPEAEVVAVSHGDPIKAGVFALTGEDLGRLHTLPLPTGGMISLEIEAAGARIRGPWPAAPAL
jgi:broad specificity phosphatase PhoE